MKKEAKAIAESKRKMARKVSKKQEKTVQADTAELNEYVVLETSLFYSRGLSKNDAAFPRSLVCCFRVALVGHGIPCPYTRGVRFTLP
jgi:hypothetical protein